ncbi:MAG: hypothetical protein ACMUHY_07410 [Thermoplasmatota archaeon]
MNRKEGYRRRTNKPVLITVWSIGLALCLAATLLMFFDMGPLPMRITFGILGVFLIATSTPFAKTISP